VEEAKEDEEEEEEGHYHMMLVSFRDGKPFLLIFLKEKLKIGRAR
jgi:hypothetical protein